MILIGAPAPAAGGVAIGEPLADELRRQARGSQGRQANGNTAGAEGG